MKCEKRYYNYDLLRIICCLAVIILHITATYKNALIEQNAMTLYKLNLKSKEMIIIFNTLTRFAVPCFVMLSGAFLLKNNTNREYKYFYNKCIKKIILPTIVFSILFFIYSLAIDVIMIILKNKDYTIILKSLNKFISGNAYYHLWYMYMIIGLYLLTPIIIRFKESISEKNFTRITYFFVVIACLSNWTSSYKMAWSVGKIFDFLGYFMLGYVIFEKNKSKKVYLKRVYIFLFIGLLFLLLLVPIQIDHINKGIAESDEKYSLVESYNPLVLCASVCIFVAFSQIKVNYDFSKIANLTMYIYFFHAIIWDLLLKCLKVTGLVNSRTSFIFVMIICTIVVFYLSCLCSIIWIKIKNKTSKNNKLYKKIDKILK